MCVLRARSARGKARFKAPSSSREGLGWGLSIARKADTLPAATSEQARKSRCPSRKREGSHFYSPLASSAEAAGSSILPPAFSTAAIAPFEAPATAKFSLAVRSEEHTSELQSLMRNSYAVFCLKKK